MYSGGSKVIEQALIHLHHVHDDHGREETQLMEELIERVAQSSSSPRVQSRTHDGRTQGGQAQAETVTTRNFLTGSTPREMEDRGDHVHLTWTSDIEITPKSRSRQGWPRLGGLRTSPRNIQDDRRKRGLSHLQVALAGRKYQTRTLWEGVQCEYNIFKK